MGSKSKDASSKLHEKHQTILADLLRNEDNKFCVDCLAKGPRWASWNLGVFMCIRCAGIHRNLGVHISRVKSVNLDSWTPEQIESISNGGNGRAREIYEANLPTNFRRPQDDYAVEQFIRSKYERKIYMAKNAPATTRKDTASQEKKSHSKQTTAKKEASSNGRISRSTKIMAVPRPASGRRSPSPQPMKTSPTPLPTNKSSAQNLLDFDSVPSSRPKTTTPKVDLLTGLSQNTSPNPAPDLMDTSQSGPSGQRPSLIADPGFVASQQAVGQHQRPSLVPDPGLQNSLGGAGTKDSIMSLYSTPQPQYNSYTPQGYPVNAYYYHQQQQASMRMAQVAQQQQLQVNQVQQQMAQIKLNRPQQPLAVGNPTAPQNATMFGTGGQTLNPHLW